MDEPACPAPHPDLPSGAPAPPRPPDSRRVHRRPTGSGVALGLFVLAAVFTLYLARGLILPLVLALMASFLLLPFVRFLSRRLRLPRGLAAALVTLGTVAALVAGTWLLLGPALDWADRLPQSLHRLERKIRPVKETMRDVDRALDKAEDFVDGKQATKVRLEAESLGTVVKGGATSVAAGFAVFVVLLFFLLAGNDVFRRKLACLLPPEERPHADAVTSAIEREVSRYLLVLSVIYLVLGTLTTLAMWLLGMPNPLLWGALAAILAFIPYLGPLIVFVVIAAASLLTFTSTTDIVLPPLVYGVLTNIEGNFLTPWILGKRLSLNPVILFVGLLFWGFIWGIPGALLAVPLLVIVRIVCEQGGPRLRGLAEFLGP